MVCSLTPLLLAGLMAADVINFTPIPHKTPFEGGPYADIAFRVGSNLATYRPPGDWRISGDEKRCVLKPPEAEAEASLESRRKPDSADFGDDAVKAFKGELASSLPKDAAKLEWGPDEKDAIIMNRHGTCRITLSYSAYSQRFTTTVLYCNFAQEQVRFQITCRETDYKKLYEEFRQSLFTFQGLD